VDLGAGSKRKSIRKHSLASAAISPSANTKPVMVAGIIATQLRTANMPPPYYLLVSRLRPCQWTVSHTGGLERTYSDSESYYCGQWLVSALILPY
jgi:hypothetical protein